jgi:hypothetical protein
MDGESLSAASQQQANVLNDIQCIKGPASAMQKKAVFQLSTSLQSHNAGKFPEHIDLLYRSTIPTRI